MDLTTRKGWRVHRIKVEMSGSVQWENESSSRMGGG